MPSILNNSVSGLLTFKRSLATTSHNIANSATEGYSRQRAELAARPGQAYGYGYVGAGVQTVGIERVRDQFIETRLRDALTDDGRTRMYAELAGRLDNLLAGEQSGLAPALSAFFNAAQDVANDPSSATPRQLLLAEAATLVDRFHFMHAEIDGVRSEMNSRLQAMVADVNALSDDIARINRDVVTALGEAGGPPNDLLDQRDQRINQLAALVGVRTVEQDNGALNVFTTSGQALVVNLTAQRWQTVPDPEDPSLLQVADAVGGIVSDKLSGGELGGLLDFRREGLAQARNELGRVATVLADTVNAQHRLGMDADGALGGDLFTGPATTVLPASSNGGSATVTATVTASTALTTSDYRLDFDGASYTLTRLTDGASVSGAGPLAMDGLQVTIGPGAAAGDRFLVKPVAAGAGLISLALSDPDRVAAAGPVRGIAALANAGDGTQTQPAVVDITDPALLDRVDLVFNNPPTTFDVVDVGSGTTLAAGVAYTPGAAVSYNGWTTAIGGSPAAGDSFRIEANLGGTADNRNALALAGLQTSRLVEGKLSYEQAYSAMVGRAGSNARSAQFNAEAREQILTDARFARESVSGVNLDEEAADLMRYQEAYQAMAQMINTSNTLFETLLAAVR